jgi:hypothetical protein
VAAETASAQVSAAVQAALAPAARYAALVTQTNPLGTAGQLLARPDISATLTAALEQAREAAAAAVQAAWSEAGGPPDSEVLQSLLGDITRQYAALPRLRSAIRTAHASVRRRRFVPGQTPPGANPSAEAVAERAAAVRDAILGFAREVALRSRVTLAVAQTAARAASALADGYARRAAGQRVAKRWMSRRDGRACHWCRNLDGVTIGLDDSFLPYLGGAADLSGHGHLTQPPGPYRGELFAPPLHPRCRCKLMIVTEIPRARAAEPPAPLPAARFISAAQIRAMPEPRYRGLVSFLRAALHELGQVLRRLAETRLWRRCTSAGSAVSRRILRPCPPGTMRTRTGGCTSARLSIRLSTSGCRLSRPYHPGMATIDDQGIIDTLLANDGIYPGDEHMPVVRIVRYVNGSGDRTYGIVYEREAELGLLHRYEQPSQFIRDPVVIFRRSSWDAD